MGKRVRAKPRKAWAEVGLCDGRIYDVDFRRDFIAIDPETTRAARIEIREVAPKKRKAGKRE